MRQDTARPPAGLVVAGEEAARPPTLGCGSPAVDVTAYRILQEALTNVLRHAGAATAIVKPP